MSYPTQEFMVNGDFSAAAPGTSSPKVNGSGQGDIGNPAGWFTSEASAYGVQTVGGRIYFNRDDTPASAQNFISQNITGVEPSGEPITFSYQFGEADFGSGDPRIRVTITDENSTIIYDRTLQTPQTVTHTFAAESSVYNVTFRDASIGTISADPWVDNVSFVAPVMCFARGTLIKTHGGLRRIETLRAGELVVTRDHADQPIRWIGSRKLSAKELDALPNLRPIRIRAGALGRNLPETDLTVSPQHRVLVRSKIAQRMFSVKEVLVAAKHLLEIDGIEVAEDIQKIEYFHILFDRHEVIFSNGAETESLHTGPQALKSLDQAARDEIFTLFPELRNQDSTNDGRGARPLIPGRPSRRLASRHSKNQRDLVELV